MRRLQIALLLWLLLCLLLLISVQALSSTNFQLNWFTPLTSGGGGVATSAEYSAHLTLGQTFIGQGSSTHYQSGLGYWVGLEPTTGSGGQIYLPINLK